MMNMLIEVKWVSSRFENFTLTSSTLVTKLYLHIKCFLIRHFNRIKVRLNFLLINIDKDSFHKY